jgi:GDPmannose 4,6-dehydratase
MSTDRPGGVALITGVTGQDGHYLSQLLSDKGYAVHGVRRADLPTDESIARVIDETEPDVVFRMITVVNASSCEIFAGTEESPQTETTALQPISPYGAAKAFGNMMCQVYRAKGLEASNAILYNHESPMRPERFVTRKITKAVAASWAPDYVDAMYRMAVHGKGDDFAVATGEAHSIADFVAEAFAAADITDWQDRVRSDSALHRPADRAAIVGDAGKAAATLDWRPTKPFADIVGAMVVSDLRQEQSP